MATLLFSVAGAALGSVFGGVGTIVGRAAGALVGRAIDQSLLSGGSDQVYEGPRLANLDVQSAAEGVAIPRIYGATRLSGQMIWATRFEEQKTTQRSGGGKGGKPKGPTQTTYSYYANFAIGLCEGEIARIGRIWADGKLLDTANLLIRVHTGSEAQAPDPLIAAKQSGAVPAYRGLAYVVFERLPLERFGNRIPQLSFEVFRPIKGLEDDIRAVCMIPGATEFGYDTQAVKRRREPGRYAAENRHVADADTDWQASLDQLQAQCPNLESVALVVSWFGDDLRCGQCRVEPAVDAAGKETLGNVWRVAGRTRSSAKVVGQGPGGPNYAGTPDDQSVIRAIQDLKARGLRVVFYPFILMDIEAGNTLPNPYAAGQTGQPAFPWRGEITCDPAPGQPGTPDKTAAIQAQVDGFIGTSRPSHYGQSGGEVTYSGPTEWTLRRQILHYAKLCQMAGGVDAFLIGSELRALTQLRSATSTYPIVQHMRALAADVRSLLGQQAKISYAADWSEYFGHSANDGSGDHHFHLDPLWSDPNVDFIGIDNYMPLADWRAGRNHLDAATAPNAYDVDYLMGNVTGGEGFEWYYASQADRDAQIRTPITDGAYNKPWVFRYKDLKAWWQNPHYDRPGGVEVPTPTAWVPQSKPFWFTEVGCPAVDKGANQPNVFVDPKSANSAVPHYSNGARDDMMQRRFLEATLGFWDRSASSYQSGNNPLSSVYGGPMVVSHDIHIWTWDARPFPIFPFRQDIWTDGVNWSTGHWLNGRLGATSLSRLVAQILDDFGFSAYQTYELAETVDGYVIDRRMSAREALEPLARALLFDAIDAGTTLRFRPRWRGEDMAFDEDGLTRADDTPLVSINRTQEMELPSLITFKFNDANQEYRRAAVSSRRLVGQSLRESEAELTMTSHYGLAERIANGWLQDSWMARERFSFALPPSAMVLEPGDIITLNRPNGARTLYLDRLEDAGARNVEGRSTATELSAGLFAASSFGAPDIPPVYGPPEVEILDLPVLRASDPAHQPRIAAFSDPWPGTAAAYKSSSGQSFSLTQTLEEAAIMGALLSPLTPGPLGRWDRGPGCEVKIFGDTLESISDLDLLSGGNLLAVRCDNGLWELLQFGQADLLATRTYRLSRLLRAQLGTEDGMRAGASIGARCVLINSAVEQLDLLSAEIGLPLLHRVGAAGLDVGDPAFEELTFTATGRGLKPLSPVHARARRLTNGDIAISFIRRTRIDGDAWDQVEVPLGEQNEAYQGVVFDGQNVARMLTANAPGFLYRLTDQATDFGGPVTQLTIRIVQQSATYGDGVPLEVTLNVQ